MPLGFASSYVVQASAEQADQGPVQAQCSDGAPAQQASAALFDVRRMLHKAGRPLLLARSMLTSSSLQCRRSLAGLKLTVALRTLPLALYFSLPLSLDASSSHARLRAS